MTPIISVLVEMEGRTFRVIDNLVELLGEESDRAVCEQRVGRRVIDLVKVVKYHGGESDGGRS